jgi:hypothetical protein
MLETLLKHRPIFATLLKASSMKKYLEPAFNWDPSGFSHRKKLQSIICKNLAALYKLTPNDIELLEHQFENSWSVQTGEHIWIPRVRSKASNKISTDGIIMPSHNPLAFQGSIYWAAMSDFRNYTFSILLGTGRVPANNPISGEYLEISRIAPLIRMIPEKWNSTPQLLIPPINEHSLSKIITALRNIGGMVSEEEFYFWLDALQKIHFEASSFTDQIAMLHSKVMNKVMPIKQLTAESEKIAINFLIELLEDNTSLTHKIFSEKKLYQIFLQKFSDINTGWTANSGPFLQTEKNGIPTRFIEYTGEASIEKILPLLKDGFIFPKGVLKFFIFMVEAGLLSIGGMYQIEYCTEIKNRSVQFLDSLGENTCSKNLACMPTEIATITPCWGTKSGERLLDVLDCITNPLTKNDLNQILHISGENSLQNAAIVLYPFFTSKIAKK